MEGMISSFSIDPSQDTEREHYKLLIGSIIPRAIAFVTMMSKDGILNGAILHHLMVPRRGIDLPNLSGKAVFIAAGTNDPICSPMESSELQSLLEKANAHEELHLGNRGHQLTVEES